MCAICIVFQIELERNYWELVNFELLDLGSLENILIIDNNTGEISVNEKVDYEAIGNHNYNVCAMYSSHHYNIKNINYFHLNTLQFMTMY